ncbi:hypothetical protein CEXT_99981 [Caerostris extrusa]|uniref:Uncharacterized protein n=1 Tax=Caerostris extrusa TaxID=172846 RepID=A0AAV4XJ84_CAEEX|nr:hypothetical protein CEXT_99981 [Caerostris extrusa]
MGREQRVLIYLCRSIQWTEGRWLRVMAIHNMQPATLDLGPPRPSALSFTEQYQLPFVIQVSVMVQACGDRGFEKGEGTDSFVFICAVQSSEPMVACCILWIGFVVHRTLPVAICDPSIDNGPGGPFSLDPNSSLQESSSGRGLPCSANSTVDRQTDRPRLFWDGLE